VEIAFLFVGLAFIAVGAIITFSELQARRGTQPVHAQVIGFSTGKSKNPLSPTLYSVAEYVGLDGRKYYIEGSIGSSAPLHALGDTVTVLVRPDDPVAAVLRSRLSYFLGLIFLAMGLASVLVFWATFQVEFVSLVLAAVVTGGLGLKIKKAWRRRSLSMAEWQDYKRQIFPPKVFTDQSKGQISWADPISVSVAIQRYEKKRRVSVPLLLALGIGFLIASHHFYGRTEAFLQKADRTSGLVIDLKERHSSDGPSTYAAVVEFSDRYGQTHKFVDSFSSSPPYYRTGQAVAVLYERENASEARMDRGPANYWLTILLGSLGALFSALAFFSARRTVR